MHFLDLTVLARLLSLAALAVSGVALAQAPAASHPGHEARFRPPPPPARHEPEPSGPFAGVISGTLLPKGASETRTLIFSAFRESGACARDEFAAVRLTVTGAREEGCLLLAVSDRQTIQIRWADGRVEPYPESDWTLRTYVRGVRSGP